MKDSLSKSQKDRIDYITYRLHFVGRVSRTDIQDRFDVKGAAATRDFRLYKDIYPGSIDYDSREKCYFASGCFPNKVNISYPQVMINLEADGLTSLGVLKRSIPISELSQQHLPNLDLLAGISKAIYEQRIISIEYTSLSSGISRRDISPLALVNTGVRWHLRAFDRKNNRFADFVINRIENITHHSEIIPLEQTLLHDKQWNRVVTLELVPHPKLKHPEAISLEYNMKDNLMLAEVRSSLVGYYLRFWQVDSTPDHSLNAPDCYLWLRNAASLADLENLSIAPGSSRR